LKRHKHIAFVTLTSLLKASLVAIEKGDRLVHRKARTKTPDARTEAERRKR
jgi:hypothetical protein